MQQKVARFWNTNSKYGVILAKLIKFVNIIHRPMLIGGFADEQNYLLVDINYIPLTFLFSVIYSLGDSLNYTWKIMNLIAEGSLESLICLDNRG